MATLTTSRKRGQPPKYGVPMENELRVPVPADMLEKVDAARGTQSRAAWVRGVVEAALGKLLLR